MADELTEFEGKLLKWLIKRSYFRPTAAATVVAGGLLR